MLFSNQSIYSWSSKSQLSFVGIRIIYISKDSWFKTMIVDQTLSGVIIISIKINWE